MEAAANCWTSVENEAAAALPQLAAFQEFCELDPLDAAAADQAAAFVFLDDVGQTPVGDKYTPAQIANLARWAVVSSADQEGFRIERVTTDGFNASGTLLLYFDRVVPPEALGAAETDKAGSDAIDRWFKNRIGSVLQQLAEYWSANGGPWLRRATVTDGPWQTHRDDWETKGHRQGCEVMVEWGVTQG